MTPLHNISNPAGPRIAALKAAFPHTVPIFAGFWFLGLAYGIYMHVLGFPFWQPVVMAAVIFGGSLEFVCGTLLLSPFAPLSTFLVALMIQARHLFYGLALLEPYKGLGKKKIYLIYGLCDETFSICYAKKPPAGIDRGWYYFWVTFLNQFYWVSGVAVGGLVGAAAVFDTKGLSFVMTAMFVTIFMEHAMQEKQHMSAVIGFLSSGIALCVLGREQFLVPSMIAILALLTLFRRRITKKGGYPER